MQHTCKDFWQVKHQGTRESLNRRTPVIRAQLELAGFHLNWTGLCVCVVQMVWEQSCELVIMLTEVVENGKVGTQTQGIACGVRFKQLKVIEDRWSRKKPTYLRIYISGLQCSHLGQNSGCTQFHNTCLRFRLKLAIFVSFPFHFSLCLCWNFRFSPSSSPSLSLISCWHHQVRCCQYWPEKNSTKDYGKFQVMTLLEQVDRVYITRRFKLRNNLVS